MESKCFTRVTVRFTSNPFTRALRIRQWKSLRSRAGRAMDNTGMFTTTSIYTGVSLSEQVPLSRPPLCNSLLERTPYRNVPLIGTNCSNKEYTKCLCNILLIGTILSSDTEYVLLIGTICSYKEYGRPYSLSEQNRTP